MHLRAGLLALLVAAAFPQQAASWGSAGHSIIAEVAQRRLHPEVAAAVRGLLGGEVSLASVSNWADGLILLRPQTFNWHFVNIPYGAAGYDARRDCPETPKGDCEINALERAQAALADRSTPEEKRLEALKFLVHFVADIHQPLHVADRNDAGGNQLAVVFFDRPMSLHAVWDYGIIERRTFDWGEYVNYLERCWFPGRDIAALHGGGPIDWAMQAHAAAVNVAYVLPEDFKLGDDYYRRSLPIVDRQLAVAGLRLARLLNAAFGRQNFVGDRPASGTVAANCAVPAR